jgi:two-component system LytT family response regulator
MPAADGAGMTAVIADDEALARRRIAALLAGCADIRVIGQCVTGSETVAAVRALCPDLLFLDVQMPGLTGFEVLAALRPDERPMVIFSTAYDEYALAAFEVHAVDYLLKPFADDRFHEAVRRAENDFRARHIAGWRDRLQRLLADVGDMTPAPADAADPGAYLERFAVRTGERLTLVDTASVDWIEAARDYVQLHVGADSHLMRAPLGELERRLDPARFLRIHRSTIVQIGRIRELHAEAHGDYIAVLRCGTRLRISRRYREDALRRLGAQW